MTSLEPRACTSTSSRHAMTTTGSWQWSQSVSALHTGTYSASSRRHSTKQVSAERAADRTNSNRGPEQQGSVLRACGPHCHTALVQAGPASGHPLHHPPRRTSHREAILGPAATPRRSSSACPRPSGDLWQPALSPALAHRPSQPRLLWWPSWMRELY